MEPTYLFERKRQEAARQRKCIEEYIKKGFSFNEAEKKCKDCLQDKQ